MPLSRWKLCIIVISDLVSGRASNILQSKYFTKYYTFPMESQPMVLGVTNELSIETCCKDWNYSTYEHTVIQKHLISIENSDLIFLHQSRQFQSIADMMSSEGDGDVMMYCYRRSRNTVVVYISSLEVESWSRWWEKRHYEMKVRQAGDCRVFLFYRIALSWTQGKLP